MARKHEQTIFQIEYGMFQRFIIHIDKNVGFFKYIIVWPFVALHSGQIGSFSNIETFLDFLDAFGSFIRVRAILEQALHAQTGQ